MPGKLASGVVRPQGNAELPLHWEQATPKLPNAPPDGGAEGADADSQGCQLSFGPQGPISARCGYPHATLASPGSGLEDQGLSSLRSAD